MIISLPIQPLTENSFTPFGQVVLGSTQPANYHGDTWASAFPIAQAHLPQGEIGWVVTQPYTSSIEISGMEREPEIEMIWTVNQPIIQLVAPLGDLKNHTQQPNANQIQAFYIQPGEIILMHPGTWHYAAFSATSKSAFYYFLTKDHPREPGWEHTAWVPFKNAESITLDLH